MVFFYFLIIVNVLDWSTNKKVSLQKKKKYLLFLLNHKLVFLLGSSIEFLYTLFIFLLYLFLFFLFFLHTKAYFVLSAFLHNKIGFDFVFDCSSAQMFMIIIFFLIFSYVLEYPLKKHVMK
jgi:hypothetical protein